MGSQDPSWVIWPYYCKALASCLSIAAFSQIPVLNHQWCGLHPGRCSCRKFHSGGKSIQINSAPITTADLWLCPRAPTPPHCPQVDDPTAHFTEELKPTCHSQTLPHPSAVPITGKHMSLLCPRPLLPPMPLARLSRFLGNSFISYQWLSSSLLGSFLLTWNMLKLLPS